MEADVRQALIYDYLRYCTESNYQPSYREIAINCGFSSSLVLADLDTLRSRGCVGWSGNRPGAIYIVGEYEYLPQ